MTLVDTSVLIDFLKGKANPKTKIFESLLCQNLPYGIASYTFHEVLQGARDEAEFNKLQEYLSSLVVFFLPEEIATYEKSAALFFSLRRQGVTVRSSIDVLISLIAIENNLLLLHNDSDFDAISSKVESLKVLDYVP